MTATPHSCLAWINLADEEIQVELCGRIYRGPNTADDQDEVMDLTITIPTTKRNLTDIVDDSTYEEMSNQLFEDFCKH